MEDVTSRWNGKVRAGEATVDCVVINARHGRLKLIIETAIDLPSTILLEYPDSSTRPCSIKWRQLNEVFVSLS